MSPRMPLTSSLWFNTADSHALLSPCQKPPPVPRTHIPAGQIQSAEETAVTFHSSRRLKSLFCHNCESGWGSQSYALLGNSANRCLRPRAVCLHSLICHHKFVNTSIKPVKYTVKTTLAPYLLLMFRACVIKFGGTI